MSKDKASLLDIVRFARIILQLIEKIDKVDFLNDIRTQGAVLYYIILVGEAVKRLSLDFRNQYSEIPWSAIAGMRDKLVHDYDGVNLERVGQTVDVYIPELLELIEPLLPTE